MNEERARRYVVSSNGNAFVAAWISILDEHKLPLGTSIPPQDWYNAFEELYLSNAIDEIAFNTCNVKKAFFSGRMLNADELQHAFWNLQYLRSSSSGEAIDNEEPIVSILLAIDGYIGQAEDSNGVEEGEWRDYILGGQGIGQMIDAARTLLNGDLGRLDAGTCDAYLCDLAERIGYDLDMGEMSGS